MTDYQTAFRNHMASNGLPLESSPMDDGQIHRFSTSEDKGGEKSGWFVLHGGTEPWGASGDWRDSSNTNAWSERSADSMNRAERERHSFLMAQAIEARDRQIRVEQEAAAISAQSRWDSAVSAAASHLYLANKCVTSYGLRQIGDELLVPIRSSEGELQSLQRIFPTGDKRFYSGGKTKAGFHLIGDLSGTVYICEGYATGASIHAVSQQGVVVAFNAGNIESVTSKLVAMYPDVRFVLAADNDCSKTHNIGLHKARSVGKKFDLPIVWPEFATTNSGSDFNDLYLAEGVEVVSSQLLRHRTYGDVPIGADMKIAEAVPELAELSSAEYQVSRKQAAKELGLGLGALDKMVKEVAQSVKPGALGVEYCDDIEAWPDPVDGQELADSFLENFNRYCVLVDGAAIAASLWAIATHCHDAFRIFPLLTISSPVKRCGKTTLLDVLGSLVVRALPTSNITAAGIFRLIDLCKPTVLIDEGDTFIGGSEELRGIINAAHNKSTATVVRVSGDGADMKPTSFSAWAPMCISMIKTPPETILDRSIVIPMRRKRTDECPSRLPFDLKDINLELRRKAKRWALDNFDTIASTKVEIEAPINDRAQDNWQPVLAVAACLGEEWLDHARQSLVKLSAYSFADEEDLESLLLQDIQEIFRAARVERMHGAELVSALKSMDIRPWSDQSCSHFITQNRLARILRAFGVSSRQLLIDGKNLNGYDLDIFQDAFSRYIPESAEEAL